MALAAGTRLGPYEILGLIGSGGMGEVYRAEDPRLGRDVALKILTTDFGRETRQRLLHEARAAAKLSHPAVALIHDVLESGEQLCLVMEFVEGETLVSRLARGPCSSGDLLRFVEELLDGLVHAHQHGIIHRDLKPANLMITPEGRVKILDFGIARIRPMLPYPGSVRGDTACHEIAGSPGYAAPEQLLGAGADARSDVYSVGVVMFEALTGHRPFEATDLMGALLAPMEAPAPHVNTLNPTVPGEVSEIVSRALERDPARRYASAQDMLQAVKRAAAGLSECPTAVLTGTIPKPRPSIWLRAAWVLALLIVLALGTPSIYRPPPLTGSAERPIVAVLPLETLGTNAESSWLGAGMAETLGMSLSKLKSLSVIPRADVIDAMKRTKDSAKIARHVGATLLVDGSIQQWQDRVRVTVRLVKADGTVTWSEGFDAPSEAIFALQSDIAGALSKQLRLAATPGERDRMARPPTISREALTEYWKGQTALESATLVANIQFAIDSFTRAVLLDPNFALAHAGLAKAYWKLYRETNDDSLTMQAVESAMKALSLDPDQPSVRTSLAVIYEGTGQYKAAEFELRRALAIDDASDEAYRQLATVLKRQGRSEDAMAALRQAVAIRPEFWRNHSELGILFYELRRLEDAKAAFGRAIELQPDNPGSHNNLGIVYAQLGDRTRALAEFERTNALEPTRRGFTNLGAWYAEAGRLDDALQAFRRALKYDTQSDLTHGQLADVLARLGRLDEARVEYQTALTLGRKLLQVNDKDAAALSRVAAYEAKLGLSQEALRHARAAIELAPRDPEVNYRLAVVQAKLGQADAALQALSRALEYGYRVATARGDPDLALLRGNPMFQKLVSGTRSEGERK